MDHLDFNRLNRSLLDNVTKQFIHETGAVVAFKIKTTSPEKFKVKPSMGVIRPGGHAEVAIHLTRGCP